MREYVEERNSGYYVSGTRISLDSVVYEFNRGAAPETILRSFPLLGSLERVYGAITYYLANREKVDEYLERQRQHWEEQRQQNPLSPELKSRLEQARRVLPR